MRILQLCLIVLSICLRPAQACEDDHLSVHGLVQPRLVRRMQPGALNASSGPSRPLEWGQINFLHTTDTHGWLAGHLRERNYGADWGDFVSFTKAMKAKAADLGVDLLLVDTGDLHGGTELSDATSPPGKITNKIFAAVDYDLLTIGNYELSERTSTYHQFNSFAESFGDRYLTSNVEIFDPETGEWRPFGRRYRYFTTEQGLRVMAFGVLYDYTGNSNVTRVLKASDVVGQEWFQDAVNYSEDIDVFVLLGHNPVSLHDPRSTIDFYHKAIRQARPDVPIQIFGGHAHTRDFEVYDQSSTGLASGRYCETLGWLSMSGFNVSSYRAQTPTGVPNPSRQAIAESTTRSQRQTVLRPAANQYLYSRRYLDWNRATFDYHASGSQTRSIRSIEGDSVTKQISKDRQSLGLSRIIGCAPRSYCADCVPLSDPHSLFELIDNALSYIVVNSTRGSTPRLYIYNGGNVRFDRISKGPFSVDDAYSIMPFKNTFRYLPGIPYSVANQVTQRLNNGAYLKRKKSVSSRRQRRRSLRHDQQIPPATAISPGYTTTDAFGTGGDDTPHTPIAHYPRPNALQVTAGHGATSAHTTFPPGLRVDLIFTSYMERPILAALNEVTASHGDGSSVTADDVLSYMPASFTSNMLLGEYASRYWQANMDDCPVS